PRKPRTAATSAITKNVNAQLSMVAPFSARRRRVRGIYRCESATDVPAFTRRESQRRCCLAHACCGENDLRFATTRCKRYNARCMAPDATRAMSTARWFGALTRVMDVGVLLLAADRTLDFANGAACTLLGYQSCEDMQQRWSEIVPLFAG